MMPPTLPAHAGVLMGLSFFPRTPTVLLPAGRCRRLEIWFSYSNGGYEMMSQVSRWLSSRMKYVAMFVDVIS